MAKANIQVPQAAVIVRALRLPFITASILPFVFGSVINTNNFRVVPFILGMLSVAGTHLGANLINDFADSKSGADWKDKKFYGLFGGSKLIQEGVLTEHFYFCFSLVCFGVAAISIVSLSVILHDVMIYAYFLAIAFLSFTYSHRPFQFSYRRLGEIIIFFLFGPALVMGGLYIQTGFFPTLEGFILSLPFGFFTTAILFSNEIPDYYDDINAGKKTWVSITGDRHAFLLYYVLMSSGFISIILNVMLGHLNAIALVSLGLFVLVVKAATIMQRFSHNKEQLVQSSHMTIQVQTFASVFLIIGVVL